MNSQFFLQNYARAAVKNATQTRLIKSKMQEPNISKFMQRPEYIRQRRQFMAANSIVRSEITDFSGNEFNSEQFQITWDVWINWLGILGLVERQVGLVHGAALKPLKTFINLLSSVIPFVLYKNHASNCAVIWPIAFLANNKAGVLSYSLEGIFAVTLNFLKKSFSSVRVFSENINRFSVWLSLNRLKGFQGSVLVVL